MIDEDIVAAKLKGYTCLIIFRDGEELLIKVPELEVRNDISAQWLMDAEKFINGCDESDVQYFPAAGLSMTRDSIKYIRQL